MINDRRPLVGIVGPLLGHHRGWVTGQGERLARHLMDDGYTVRTTSGEIGRLRRAIGTVRDIWSWRHEVDVVVVMVFSGPAFLLVDLATRTARRAGIPIVLWLHGGNLPRFARRHPRWLSRVGQRAAAVVAPSPFLATLTAFTGTTCTTGPVEIIPNVLDAEVRPFQPRPHLRPRLLWMRTFHPLYCPATALDVLSRVLITHPDTTLTMAGQDKGALTATQAHARALGLSARVTFPGFLDPAAKARAFLDHDVFLNTSGTDNAPVSLLEAAAHGVPIVSTDIGGIPVLFPDGKAALLAEEPAGLAEAVTRLLDDPVLAASLGAAAHDRALRSTWPKVGPRWQELLADTMSGARRG